MYRNLQQRSHCGIDPDNLIVCDCGRRYPLTKHFPVRCPCGRKVGLDRVVGPHNKFQNTKGIYGFIGSCYNAIGGTESWHQSLLPRLKNVAGLVSLNTESNGDPSPLDCPYDTGLAAAKQLAEKCKVLVVWCVGDALYEITKGCDCKVISINHSDFRSKWSTLNNQLQANKTDVFVTICPSAEQSVPKGKRHVYIPNAPDPKKLKVTTTINKPADKKIALMCCRLSREKNIDKAIEIFNSYFQEDWELWIVGKKDTEYQYRVKPKRNTRIFPATPFPGNYYAVADLYISCSNYEGYGLSSAEALLAGLPVVSTPVGLFEHKPHLATTVRLNASDKEWVHAINTATVKPIDDLDRIEDFVANWQNLLDSLAQ